MKVKGYMEKKFQDGLTAVNVICYVLFSAFYVVFVAFL